MSLSQMSSSFIWWVLSLLWPRNVLRFAWRKKTYVFVPLFYVTFSLFRKICGPSKAIPRDQKKTEKGRHPIQGIPNIGNTCYMNAILQVLIRTPKFREHLQKATEQTRARLSLQTSAERLLSNIIPRQFQTRFLVPPPPQLDHPLLDLVDAVNSESHVSSTLPRAVLNVVRQIDEEFKGNGQHDSYQLFNTVIEGLENLSETKRTDKANEPASDTERLMNNSPVSRLFGGVFCIIYTYNTCDHIEPVFQRFTSISVHIPPQSRNRSTRCKMRTAKGQINVSIEEETDDKINMSLQQRKDGFQTNRSQQQHDTESHTNGLPQRQEAERQNIGSPQQQETESQTNGSQQQQETESQTNGSQQQHKGDEGQTTGPLHKQEPENLFTGSLQQQETGYHVDWPKKQQEDEGQTTGPLHKQEAENHFNEQQEAEGQTIGSPQQQEAENKFTRSPQQQESEPKNNGTVQQQEAEGQTNGSQQDDVEVQFNGSPERQETAVQSDRSPEQQETAVQSDRSPEQQETVDQSDRSPEQQETAVQSDRSPEQHGAVDQSDRSPEQQETAVQSDRSSEQQETAVQSDRSPEQQETAVQSDRSPEQQETVDQSDRSPEQQETAVQSDRSSEQQETLDQSNDSPQRHVRIPEINDEGDVKLKTLETGYCYRSLKIGRTDRTDLEEGLKLWTDIGCFRDLPCRICEKNSATGANDQTTVTRSRILLMSLPPVLVLQFNRFTVNSVDGSLQKMNGELTYPEYLDAEPYCSSAVTFLNRKNGSDMEEYQYRLYGVVSHVGSIRGGHYTAHVRTIEHQEEKGEWRDPQSSVDEIISFWKEMEQSNSCLNEQKLMADVTTIQPKRKGTWYTISDDRVEEDKYNYALHDPNAYLLFYERV